MYSNNDYRDYLEHSWGKKPEQKAREAEYNHSYYQTHKEKWKEYARKALGVDAKENYDRATANKEYWDNAAERADRNANKLEDDYRSKLGEAAYYEDLAQTHYTYDRSKGTGKFDEKGRQYRNVSQNKEFAAENWIKPEAEKWKKNSNKTNQIRDRVATEQFNAYQDYLRTPLGKASTSNLKFVRAGAKFIEDKLKRK